MLPPPGLDAVTTAVIDNAVSVATVLDMASTVVAPSSPDPTASSSQTIYEESPSDCSLLGSFAILVQAALGALALLALVFKRWRERPQRPVKIWFFDVSKQVFGSVLVHMANIFMSMLTSGRFSVQVDPSATTTTRSDDNYTPNPCSFYLLNLAIDVCLARACSTPC
jgi:hypothetical protein